MERHDSVIIGGGQAGLAVSHHLRERGREHILIERDQLGGRWHSERWDSLHYQFPNWSLRLPGHCYEGDDPEGFPHHSAVVDFLAEYADKVAPPVRLGVEVRRVGREDDLFMLETDRGTIAADRVVVATGAFPRPRIPEFAAKLSPSIAQLHSSAYRSPGQLPGGAVLVVGSGSSGGQIAEELHRSGRRVLLSVSRHRRVPRRFLGKDMTWWFFELGWMDRPIGSFPDRKPPAAILLSGIDGGHDLDIRTFGMDGVSLLGRAVDADGMKLCLADNLSALLADADAAFDQFVQAAGDRAVELGMKVDEQQPQSRHQQSQAATQIDLAECGVTSIIWCTGYGPAFDWIDIPVFDSGGAPIQERGRTDCPGLYFLGLHWMHSFKSGALFGVGDDAAHIAGLIDF
jgi:putative flavoprotein involved in K+ transport